MNPQDTKLQKILELAKIADSLTATQAKQFVELLVNLTNKQKEELIAKSNEFADTVSQETHRKLNEAIGIISEKHKDAMLEVRQLTNKQKDAYNAKMSELEGVIAELKAIEIRDGVDGVDADEEVIVEKVLAKIPAPKEVVLDDADQIVAKINTTTGKIEAKTIRGLVETIDNISKSNIGNIPRIAPSILEVLSNGTNVQQGATRLNFLGGATYNNGTIEIPAGITSVSWGSITGTLSNQTDLQNALNAKQNALTNPVTGTGTSGQIAFWDGTNTTTGTNNLFWDNVNNRLGIGITSPQRELQVNVSPNATRGILVTDNNDTTKSVIISSSNGATAMPYIGTNGNQRLDLGVNGGRTMTLDTNSSVGINTTTPFTGLTGAIGLDIGVFNTAGAEGNLMVRGYASLGGISRASYGAVGSNYYLDTAGALRRRFNDSVSILDFSAGGFYFRTAGNGTAGSTITTTELARMLANGNFLIGGTTDGGFKLDVTGTFRSSGTATIGGNIALTGGVKINFATGGGFIEGADTYLRFATNAGTERMRIDSLGNVGIGTASPTFRLQVEESINGNGGMFVRNSNTGTSTIAAINVAANTGNTSLRTYSSTHSVFPLTGGFFTDSFLTGGMLIFNGANAPTMFYTNSSERMRITSGGNVGIGLSTISAVLHLKAGTATAGTAPLKFTSGPLLTTPEAGAFGYNNTLHFTNSDGIRRNVVLSDGTYTAGLVVVGGKVRIRIGGTDYNVLVE